MKSMELGANTQPNSLSESDFVELYGKSMVTLGEREVTLDTALAMEEAFCPADPEQRQDESERLSYLARLVGENILLPEHQYLLK